MEEADHNDLLNAQNTLPDQECRLCKYVFALALVAVFAVILFTYFFNLHTPPSIEPLPQNQVHPASDAEWQARILELKKTASGEGSATSSTQL